MKEKSKKLTEKKFVFGVYDCVFVAMLTALSIAFKAVVVPLVRLLAGPLGIPGGALAGGFYMFWLVLPIVILKKHGGAMMIGLVQIIVLLATSLPGSHGIWTIVTYFLPTLGVELVFLFVKKDWKLNILHFVLAVSLANVIGTYSSNFLFYRLTTLPLVLTLMTAALSGVLGGVLCYFVYRQMEKTQLTRESSVIRNSKLDGLIESIYEVSDEKE